LQALKYTNYRSLTTLTKTGIPGPEGSASKLVWSENNPRLTKLALEILGSHAQLTDGGGYADGYWQYQQLRSRGHTIEAGTIEIDGFVPHLEKVTRVLTADMQSTGASGETVATVDETLGLGRLSRNGTEAADGNWDDVRRRLLAALALEAVGIGWKVTGMALEYAGRREQ